MEVLAGVMTGAGFGRDHRPERIRTGKAEPDFGHFMMAIAPELFMPGPDFKARVSRLIEQTKAGDRAENVEEILIPGEREMNVRAQNLRDGVPLLRSTYDALVKYGEEKGLDSRLVPAAAVKSH
jgi:LDH2 family malate/lactate/ureidoglycolate dehydrogenase